MPAPLVIAHRGDSACRPENTLASFASALQVGASIVEFDVQLTKDGDVVVLHDVTLDRTTTGTGSVRQLTLREVRSVSAGYPTLFGAAHAGERVPVLAEVLHLLKDRAMAMIEVKSESVTDDDTGGIEAATLEAVRKVGMEREVVIISFSHRALRRFARMAPQIVRGHLFHRGAAGEMLAGARDAACEILMPEKRLLTDDLRDLAREAGLKLATWVVDDAEELRQLARFDLYGIGSNRPAEMMEAVRELEVPS